MTKQELYAIAADAVNDAELTSAEIPSIDLYVDQILSLVSDKLAGASDRYQTRQLTKTMINNYSKDDVISEVKGKKYTKEQVLQILLVYSLKNTLSIGEIKRLLKGAYSAEGFDAKRLTALYDKHEELKGESRARIDGILDGIAETGKLDVARDDDYILTVCALASLSAQLKNVAQAMIDARFPEPDENESDDKEKDKDKTKEEKKKVKEEKQEKKKEVKESKEKEKKNKKDGDKK